jgi:A/G-specific adenine glycosylase
MLMKQGKVLLRKRPTTGIWGGLWCLPEMAVREDAIAYCIRHFGMKVKPLAHMPPLDHTFTHFRLRIHPQPLQVVSCPAAIKAQGQDETMWITLDDALKAAIPAPVRKLLMRHGYQKSGQLPLESNCDFMQSSLFTNNLSKYNPESSS